MNVNGSPYRTIWWKDGHDRAFEIIDQRWLPHDFVIETLGSVDEVVTAIAEMHVRGAPLIGAAGASGAFLAISEAGDLTLDEDIARAAARIKSARPTAVNLSWGVDRVLRAAMPFASRQDKLAAARKEVVAIHDEEVERSKSIGDAGASLLVDLAGSRSASRVNVLTHCNAGWLCAVDYGTATAPIYRAFDTGLDIHVWVDETRPRNQGARLTAWELGEHGVPHTVIADNTAGHLMQTGQVDIVIVGTDRTTRSGDVVNKIGTYTKALAARDNDIPFYVAAPSSSIDWSLDDGRDVPIERREGDEVRFVQGLANGKIESVLITPESSPVANYAFDVTPARLVTGLITERGICRPVKSELQHLFPELMPT